MFNKTIYTLLLFICPLASAGTIDPETPDHKYVEFGKSFPFVVQIKSIRIENDQKLNQWGSAVIIAPHWIITAAHVVHQTSDSQIVKDDGKVFSLRQVIIHPDFEENNLGEYDLALGYCSSDFDMEFYCGLYQNQDELNQAVTIAGYGFNGTFKTGSVSHDGKKRAGHNRVEGIEKSVLICKPDKSPLKFPLEFIITPGDSGGGLFIGNQLAGINSYLMAVDKKPNGTYTDEAAHIRISVYASWINTTIKQYEQQLMLK